MRTIDEIFNEMIAYKESNHQLDGLTSTSKTAVWRLMFYIVAVSIWMHEKVFYLFKSEVETIIANSATGTIPWYHKIALAFQLGDELTIFEDGKIDYETIDTEKQIIKRCAVVEDGNILLVKVAKETNGVPEPLSTEEKDAFSDYMKQRKFAGTRLIVYNYPPDELNIHFTIYYDPQILKSDGSLIQGETMPVNIAIENYIKNIKFGGKLVKNHLIDSVQQAEGVCDLVLHSVKVKKFNDADYTTIQTNAIASYSGYFVGSILNISYSPCNIQ